MSSNYFSEDKVKHELSLRELLIKVWPYLHPLRRSFYHAMALVLIFVCLGRSLPFLVQHAIDEGILKHDLQLVVYLAMAYLVFETLRAILSFVMTYSIHKIGNRVLHNIRSHLLLHIQRLPVRFFDKTPVGRIVTRATNDVSSMGELFTEGFTDIVVNIIEMASIILALTIISGPLTGFTILICPVLFWLSFRISQRIRVYFTESKKKMAAINSFTAETINGMKVVHLFNQETAAQHQFKDLSEEYRHYQLQAAKMFALLWPLLEAFHIGTVAAALFFGTLFHSYLGLSLGELGAFILLIQAFFRPLRVILERYNQVQNAITSADRVFSLLSETPEPEGGLKPEKGRFAGNISFESVSFRYDPQNPYALKEVSIEIPAGESLALVGRTGSGKTTFISLLQRLYEYEEGQIKIDGMPLEQLDRHFLRSRLGLVLQDPFMFKGSIASNISLDDPKISAERIAWAAEQSQCQSIFANRPKGLESPIEEGGTNLSLGEKQLIALARVLAFDPDILILDEATSNVDSLTEAALQKAIEAATRERTSFIIAHRLSTIRHCDRIAVLHNSHLVELGNHLDLLKRQGHYSQMHLSAPAHG